MKRLVVVAAVVASSLSGCGRDDLCNNAADLLACTRPGGTGPTTEASSTPIPLSTSSWKPGDLAMAALIKGRIQLSQDGCVYLKTAGVRNDVIWPAGYSADVSTDGVLTVRNPAGEPVGHEGTKISVGGGGFSEDEGGIPDRTLRLLVCQVSDSVLYINDELPPL